MAKARAKEEQSSPNRSSMGVQDVGYAAGDPCSKHEYEEVKLLRRMHGTRILEGQMALL